MQMGYARVSPRDQQLALAEATAVAAETFLRPLAAPRR
jgi:hypothetical protein